MRDALEIVKNIKGNPQFQYSYLIKRELTNYDSYRDYLNGYQRINKIRKRLDIEKGRWDAMLKGSKSIPLIIYKQSLRHLRNLNNKLLN